jgi:hypothetical protein
MGWQAGDLPRPDGEPGGDGGLPELLAKFEHGGGWDKAAPSAALAAVLEAVAGPDGQYQGAGPGALVGIARQWAALESWASAGLLAALRSMMRENGDGQPLLRRDLGMPDGWDDSLTYELAEALAMGPMSAANLAGLAHTLGLRLPGIGRLLAEGVLTRPKAKLIVGIFEPLSEDEAARAEALILGELAGKTWFQVERLAWRAAVAVAPDVVERRRRKAEKRARVTVFREESGTVGLSGRDLPAAQALSGHANVLARAQVYQASGAFPNQTMSSLEALAYMHLLNNVSAQDAIAFASTTAAAAPPRTAGQDEEGEDRDSRVGCAHAPGDRRDNHDDDQSPDSDDDPGRSHNDGDGPDDDGPDDDHGPDDDGPGGGGDDSPGGAGSHPGLVEVTVPLATLLAQAERAGENRLLGPLDPALTRELALAAARSPHSRWEVTVVDEHGYAVGHGPARPARGSRHGPRSPGSPGYALPARVNITITETLLQQLAAQSARSAQPRSGAPPGDWALTPRSKRRGDQRPDEYGTWTLTLPGGQVLGVRFDVVPTHACDHRYQASTYQPTEKLRRLVQIRDHECTFPPCSRPAHQSDFEHAIPYHKGGPTDACNAGARSRRCHQVKQSRGWTVTQPKPGWHVWTTPTGRTYTQGPWRYIA